MGYLHERFGLDMVKTAMKPGCCPVCGRQHAEDQPHDQQSLMYQYHFYDQNGRWASWADAMAHCPQLVQGFWRDKLAKCGVDADERPKNGNATISISRKTLDGIAVALELGDEDERE